MKDTSYFYVACEAGASANEEYRHYFRLYRNHPDGKPRLVDQGLAEKVAEWGAQFNATLSTNNPYPHLD